MDQYLLRACPCRSSYVGGTLYFRKKKGSGAVFFSGCGLGAVSARTGILPLGIPEKKFQWSGLLKFFLELPGKRRRQICIIWSQGRNYVPHNISACGSMARGKEEMNLPSRSTIPVRYDEAWENLSGDLDGM